MRITCSILSLAFLFLGVVFIEISLSENKMGLNTPKVVAGAIGLGLIGISGIIILLVLILHELKSKP